MEKLQDNQFVIWQKEYGPHGKQNIHPATARKLFWETKGDDKFSQIGISKNIGYRSCRDVHFTTVFNFSAFDEAVISFQEAMGYATGRNGIIYKKEING